MISNLSKSIPYSTDICIPQIIVSFYFYFL